MMSEAGTLEQPLERQQAAASSASRRFAASGSTLLLGFVLPVGAALAYEAAFRFGLVQARLLPPPSKVGSTLWDLARSGELSTHVIATMTRVLLGFGLGALVGMLLGALTGSSSTARKLLDPTLQALRAIPSLAWVPLFILWLGIFENSKIALIATGVFFPVYLGVMAAIANVDRKIVEVGRAFRLSKTALARRVLLPAILPDFIVALRSGLGLGFMFVVAAEIMGASEGLGYLLVDGQQLGKPDQILAAIIAFAILGKIFDWLLVSGSRPFLTWQDSHSRAA
ncbi:MAG: ABC transporter permease [Beijerinckiaceae bacterium]|nr:ABC transporter permease [Beijerinckiaceae bacterium]